MAGSEQAWDLVNNNDHAIATGIYLFTIKDQNNGEIKTGKFLMMKKLLPLFLFISLCTCTAYAQISSVGGFEGDLPSYWMKGAVPPGSTLEWATDQSRSMGKSLKITKGVTAEAAVWESENMVDLWSPQHLANVDIKIGAWVRTQGVNTNPTTEDEKWKISYTFYNEFGSLIGETVIDLDQSTASSGAFIENTNGVGQTILPVDSWTTIIKFIGGKDATGTVWADDFIFIGRGGAWAGEAWNNSVAYPTGWIDWLQPNGGKDGQYTKGYENTLVTDEESHSGLKSLKFDLPINRETGDGWVGTKRMLFQGTSAMTGSGDLLPMDINPGDMIRISVWLKANNLVPDSAALYPETWAVGFTYGYFKGVGNNDGWNPIDGFPVDMQFVLPSVTQFDWTQYYIDVQVPNDPEAVAMSVRLHVYARFTGTVYWDDLKVETLLPGFLGDVNGDDNCNSTDALIILSYDVGLTIPPDFLDRINAGIGDVNSDGQTNSTDALILLSFDVGIPVPFPVCEPFSPATAYDKLTTKNITN